MTLCGSPARTPDGYRAAGDGAICTALSNLATYDGGAHPCHARRRDQGCPRVEWHDPCAIIHSWFLEPYFCLAKVALALAILSTMGARGRGGPT